MTEIQIEKELESVLGQQPGLRILDSMGFSIAILNPDLKIVWANRGYHEMHGILNEDITGRYCYEVSFGH